MDQHDHPGLGGNADERDEAHSLGQSVRGHYGLVPSPCKRAILAGREFEHDVQYGSQFLSCVFSRRAGASSLAAERPHTEWATIAFMSRRGRLA